MKSVLDEGARGAGGSAGRRAGRPGAAAVLEACQRATAGMPGMVLEVETTGQGVRVRFCPREGQQVALLVLGLLGYEVWEDTDPDDQHGAALVVTGWSRMQLLLRAERLECAVAHLRGEVGLRADRAVQGFCGAILTDAQVDRDAAAAEVVAEIRREFEQFPAAYGEHVSADVHPGDRAGAGGALRVLLDRVAAGEHALRQLRDATLAVARTGIELFRTTHVAPGADAKQQAVRLTKMMHGTQLVVGADEANCPVVAGIVVVCEQATAQHGDVEVRTRRVTDGVRVDFSSAVAPATAAAALRHAGYAVVEHDSSCVVTGWDVKALTARVERVADAVRALDQDVSEWAGIAIHEFRRLVSKGVPEDAAAVRAGMKATREERRKAARVDTYRSVPVGEDDLTRARGEVGVLLDDVALGERALSWLPDVVVVASALAIKLYRALRAEQGVDEDAAAQRAVQVVTQAVGWRAAVGRHIVGSAGPKPSVAARGRNFLVDVELVLSSSGQTPLTTEGLLGGLMRLSTEVYGGWTVQELTEAEYRLGAFKQLVRPWQLLGPEPDGLRREDVVRMRRVAAWVEAACGDGEDGRVA